jgi:hypothetical protein
MGRYFSKRAFKRRLGEPSTWAGVAILASVAGQTVGIPPDLVNAIIVAGGALAGVLPEQAPKE